MSYISQFLTFLSVISVVLFGSHVFLYLAIRHFFDPGDTARKTIIIVFGFLSVSFIISSIVVHWYDNLFSRGLYYCSAVWLGILSNAFFIFAILWILSSLISLMYSPLPLLTIGWMGVITTVLLSLYGIMSAANPIIRENTVYIQNLPSEWEGKKVVQINDVHLGYIIRSDFAQRVVDMTNTVSPAAVFIIGDLFDGMDGSFEWLIEPFNNLHSPYGTYFVTGNHETYIGTGRALDIIKKTNIHPIDNILLNLGGLQLIGITFPERGDKQDVTEVLKKIGYDSTKPSILLYHAPTHIDIFSSLGISLQLSGHTHYGQLYPYNLITNLIFHGYDFWVYHKGDYTLSVSSGVGTWWPPMRTNSRAEIVVLTLKRK